MKMLHRVSLIYFQCELLTISFDIFVLQISEILEPFLDLSLPIIEAKVSKIALPFMSKILHVNYCISHISHMQSHS